MYVIPSVRDITILYPMGIATMDTFRRQQKMIEKVRRDKHTHEMVPYGDSSSQLWYVDRTSGQIVIEGCGFDDHHSVVLATNQHHCYR